MNEQRRFAILTHDHPELHWDLMLDTGEVLRTWRLETEPLNGSGIRALPLPDHRQSYLDYEGPVSGNRGTVTRWDGGTFAMWEATPSRLKFRIDGNRLQGIVEMVRDGAGIEWTFVFLESASESS